jgi:mRNA interferase YafQ
MASPAKGSSSKRTNPPRLSDYTKQLHKDWERLTRSGRYNMRQLKEAMLLLIANDGPLPAEWRDHELTGDWSDHRECHVGGDFLLIHRLDDTGRDAKVVFVRAGTHAELFE